MKLEQEDAQLGIFGMGADFVLQGGQGLVRLARGEVFFGGHESSLQAVAADVRRL